MQEITFEHIVKKLPADFPWLEFGHVFSEIDSTNNHAKELAKKGAPGGTWVVADRQTAGRGRMGRSFHSPAGLGVYLSVILRPNCSAKELMHLTCAAAVAMCESVEAVAPVQPGIKWTNDLVVGKRKLGGILTELGLSAQGQIDFIIIGIGINCCHQSKDFPPELQGIATSIRLETGAAVDCNAMVASMLRSLQKMEPALLTGKEAMLNAYRSKCITLGQDVCLVAGQEISYGKALDVDEQGGLVVRFQNGQVKTVAAGEVSVRGMYGYV